MTGSKYISPLSPRYLLHLSDIVFLSFCRRRREVRSHGSVFARLRSSASILSSDAFWILINALLQICSSLLSFASTYATADILGAVVEGDSRAAVHGLLVSLLCYSALGICLAMTARLGEELRVSMRYNLTRYLHALYFQPRAAYWCTQGAGPGCAAAEVGTGTGTGSAGAGPGLAATPPYAYPLDSVDQRLTQDVDSLSRQLCLVLFGGYSNMYAGLVGSLASLLITITAVTALSPLPAGIGLAFALLMTAALAALAERLSRAYYASDKGMGMLRSHFARQGQDALQVTLLQGRQAEEDKGNRLLQAYYFATLRYYGVSALQAVVSGFAAGYPYVLSLGCCLVVIQVLGPSALSTYLDAAADGAGESDDPSGVDPIALSTASAILASYISALTALPSLWSSFGALGGALGRVYELLQALRLIHGGTGAADTVVCSTLNWRPVSRRGTAVGDRGSRFFSTYLVQPLVALARLAQTGPLSHSTAQGEEEDGEGSGGSLLSLLTEQPQPASHASGLGAHPPTAPLPIGAMEVADAIRTWVASLPVPTVQDRDSTVADVLAPLLIVQAPSGTGKSSAVRVLSGLWPVPPDDAGWQGVVRACLGGRTALFIPQAGSDTASEEEGMHLSAGSGSGDLCPPMESLPTTLACLSQAHALDLRDQGALQQALRTYGAVAQSRCIPVGVTWLSLSSLVGVVSESAGGLLSRLRECAAWRWPGGAQGGGRRAAGYGQLYTETSDCIAAIIPHSPDPLPLSVWRVPALVAARGGGGGGETAREDGTGSGHAARPCGTAVFLDEPFPTLSSAAQAAAIAALRRAVREGSPRSPAPSYVVLLTTDGQTEQSAALDGSQEGVTVVRLGGFRDSATKAAGVEGRQDETRVAGQGSGGAHRMSQLLQGMLPTGTVRVCAVTTAHAPTPAQAPALTSPKTEGQVQMQGQGAGRPAAAFDALFRARLLRILSVLSPYWTPPCPGPMTSPALLAAVTCASIAGCIGLALITVVVSSAPGMVVAAILAGDATAAWTALARATGLYLLSPCLGALTRFLGRHLSLLLYTRLVQEGNRHLSSLPPSPSSAVHGGGPLLTGQKGEALDRIDQRLVADSLSLANGLGVLCFGGDGRLPLLQVLATIVANSVSIMSRGHSGWALACVFAYALTGIMLNKAALSRIPAALALVSAAESMLRATHVRVRSACEAVALQGTEREQGGAAEVSLAAVSVSALHAISAEFTAKLINALVANVSTVAAYGFGALLCFNSATETAANAYTLTFLLMSLLMYVAALPDYATAAAEVAGYTARVGVLFEALGMHGSSVGVAGVGEQEEAAAGLRGHAAEVAWGQEEVTIHLTGKAGAVRLPLPRAPGEIVLCQGLGAEEAEAEGERHTSLLLALALSLAEDRERATAGRTNRQLVLLPSEPYVPSPPCSLLAAVLYPQLPPSSSPFSASSSLAVMVQEAESGVLAVLRACGLEAACRAAAGKVRGHRGEAVEEEDESNAAFLHATEVHWRAVLSRGERSRLALARALFSLRSSTGTDSPSQPLTVPTVLCASDPFQGLDPAAALQCAQAVQAHGVGLLVLC